jgi:predicted transcriptional regulator
LVIWCFYANVGINIQRVKRMSRLTISLDDNLHRALKETAARQGRSITSIVEESLRLRGIQEQASARALVAQARDRAQLSAEAAIDLAVKETRAARKQ